MKFSLRRALLSTGCALLIAGAVAAQGLAQYQAAMGSLAAQSGSYGARQPLSGTDSRLVSDVMAAARSGDATRIRADMDQTSDPLAHKLALWALMDAGPAGMTYAELEAARRDLADWPHADRRSADVERSLPTAGLDAKTVIAWFGGAAPATPEGAMALASAYQASGQGQKAADLIRSVWRTMPFDVDAQRQMLSQFGAALTADDHAAREDMLLYGAQGPAARDMIALLSPDQQALAQARMAIRAGGGVGAAASLPGNLKNTPGLAFEEALADQRNGDSSSALALMPLLPTTVYGDDAQTRMWKLRSALVIAALKTGDSRAAYAAAANSGLATGKDAAEAEFYAGWLALSRLNDPKLADEHFTRLQNAGSSPITVGRALYWRGRALEAQGDPVNAQLFYADAAKYQTTFYGQLAAAKTGQTQLVLGRDPTISPANRAAFEAREPVRAARLLGDLGERDAFKALVCAIAENLPDATQAALLVDLARSYGDQSLSMKVVRTAAQHGLMLPERGYPVRSLPAGASGPETAFVLGIVRQESGFDPTVRSGAGAQGMMQLMPGTARILARKLGYTYSGERLDDADYNMQLGSAYLGQLVDQFSGSYIMAAAAYNAGPGRPTEWTTYCGDPRSSSSDPANYIECIPFSETRNYVMRVLENTEVYRARLAGGAAPLNLAADLKRGTYGYSADTPTAASPPGTISLNSTR